jgi:hypothetical protein
VPEGSCEAEGDDAEPALDGRGVDKSAAERGQVGPYLVVRHEIGPLAAEAEEPPLPAFD